MAKGITLKTKNGATGYPKSVTDLIFDNATGKTLKTIIDELKAIDAATDTRTQFYKASVTDLDALNAAANIGTYNYVGNGWRGLVQVCLDHSSNVAQVALSSSSPSYNGNVLSWIAAQPCAMARVYRNGAWSHWEKVGAPVVNDLTTGGTDKALSAEMGKTLKEGLDALGPESIYDVSARNSGVTFASLSALLSSGNLSTLIPTAVRHGGMSIRFIQTSDNRYVQYRLMKNEWSTNTEDWVIADEGVYVENPEFLYVRTDAEGKIVFAIKTDGKILIADADFLNDIKNNQEAINEIQTFLDAIPSGIDWNTLLHFADIESPEYISIEIDSEGKILSYRDNDGVKHEVAGMKVNDISFGKKGKDSIINVVKELYPNPTNWSDKEYLEIPTPKCAVMNITNIYEMPTTKTDDLQAVVETWDMQGNYFKKTAIINAQGNSSLSHAKKNFALDFLNGEWDEDSAFVLKIGKWVSQDSFHFKAYYTDFFVGIPVIGYKLYDDIVRTRSIYADRTWKRALLPSNQEIGTITGSMADCDYNLCLDSGARCFPDGFPVIVYLNGEYYGIFCWQLKKHRDNYHQTKDDGKHIHLDGNISSALLWSANGNIDWYKWAGITYESESSLNQDGIEIRNPKDLVLRNGDKYDHDTIHLYPSTADVKSIEIVGEDDSEYATLMSEAEAMADEKKRKKRIKQIKYTAAVKQSVIDLSEVIAALSDAESTESAESMKALIATYFDVDSMIDYQIFCDVTNNVDGIKKNWQWNTWDGSKWAVNPYDLDGIFGIYGADGSTDQQPRNNHIGNVSDNPCYWILKYFNTELEARYGELRRKKIIDAERIASELNNWTLNIGLDNYERELEKWPERRSDNIYRFRNWCITSIQNMDNVYHYSE